MSADTQPAQFDWSALGYARASKYREAALGVLADGAAIPTAVADSASIRVSHASRALRQLEDRGLVELLVPDDQQKGRYYGLTPAGEAIAAALSNAAELEPPAVADVEFSWADISFVTASRKRRICLGRLADGAAMPTTIADGTGLDIASVSAALSDLREAGLVELLVADSRRKGRYYGLTPRGVALAEHPEVEP